MLDTSGDWRRVRGDHDEYEGWMHAGYLIDADPESAGALAAGGERMEPGRDAPRLGQDGAPPAPRPRARIDDGGVRLPDGRRAEVIEGAVHPVAGL